MNIPIELALGVTNAELVDSAGAPAEVCVSTDSRAIVAGETFLALRGEQYDGHAYTADAVERGASMIVIDRPQARVAGTPAMIVRDTLQAYMALAGAARNLFHGRVLAITGSNGKTTTKEFLAQLAAVHYGERILATPANENNEIGVSKLLLHASNGAHDLIVAELGARRYGDIAALVAIVRPDVGVLTNIGEAHLEIMGSPQRLEETKWALFETGARAVLNAHDAASRKRAAALERPPHWFSAQCERDAVDGLGLDRVTALAGRAKLLDFANGHTTEYAVDVRVPGLYNCANLVAAIAGAIELDVPLRAMVPAIADVRLPAGRYAIERVGGLRVIYDAYNANASATIAALDAFAEETAVRRIAVLAGMAELGAESEAFHERVGAHAAATVDVLLVTGDFADALARGARRGGLSQDSVVRVGGNAEAARWLRDHARHDDAVLLKGSRKYRMEEIVDALRTAEVSGS